MDTTEATKIVMSRIQNLDSENASRIMGYILIQDLGEKEMIRLAFGTDAVLLSYIAQAKAYFALHSSNNVFPQIRIPIPNFTAPHSPPMPNFTGPHSPASFPSTSPRPIPISSSPYAAAVLNCNDLPPQFYGNDSGDELFPSGRFDTANPFHRRCHSVNDAGLPRPNLEDGGFGLSNGEGGGIVQPCMYFAKGFCKNGGSCKFFHGGDEAIVSRSPSADASDFDEFIRMKALQQRRSSREGSRHPFSYIENRRFGPRNESSQMGLDAALASNSRQIYLTFPADSPFREEDVSSYFSMFGPVQDVRIPYQHKRMFGFVTFVFPETVKLILAKGNPHFVCNSRVLVKPYKEKGKVPDKKQLQQQLQYLEREEYPSYSCPFGVDSEECYDPAIGSRMLSDTQEMILRRKLEQELELQHAIEIQGQRMRNIQLMGQKYQQNNRHFLPSLTGGVPISSPRSSQVMGENVCATSDSGSQDVLQAAELDNGQETSADGEKLMLGRLNTSRNNCSSDKRQDDENNSYLLESLEHILPDNLFSSPKKSAAEHQSIFSRDAPIEVDKGLSTNNSASTSRLGVASLC